MCLATSNFLLRVGFQQFGNLFRRWPGIRPDGGAVSIEMDAVKRNAVLCADFRGHVLGLDHDHADFLRLGLDHIDQGVDEVMRGAAIGGVSHGLYRHIDVAFGSRQMRGQIALVTVVVGKARMAETVAGVGVVETVAAVAVIVFEQHLKAIFGGCVAVGAEHRQGAVVLVGFIDNVGNLAILRLCDIRTRRVLRDLAGEQFVCTDTPKLTWPYAMIFAASNRPTNG